MKIILFIYIFLLFFFSDFASSEDNIQSVKEKKIRVNHCLDLGVVFKESGEYDKAIDILEQETVISKDERLMKYLGKLSYLNGQPEKAYGFLNSIQNKDWICFLYLGLIQEELGDKNAAVKCYLKSIKLYKNSIAFFRLGKIYRYQENYDQAVDAFFNVLDLDPSIRLANYYLGECLSKIKNTEKAYKYLVKAKSFYSANKFLNKKVKILKNELGEDYFKKLTDKKEVQRKEVRIPSYKEEVGVPLVRVGLAKDLESFTFSCGSDFVINDSKSNFKGYKNKLYKVLFRNGKIYFTGYKNKKKYKTFISSVKINSINAGGEKHGFYVLDMVHGAGDFWHKQVDRAYRGDLEIVALKNKGMLINILSVEDYLYGVLSAEIPANSKEDALKAQAVAARTHVYTNMGRHKKDGFDFCTDVHCQVYQGISSETEATNKAVKDTKSEIIGYVGKPIEIFYHANCGGCLSSDVFGKFNYFANKIDSNEGTVPDTPYNEELWFQNVPDHFCSNISKGKSRWQRVYDEEDFIIAFGYKLIDLKSILPLEKGECFRFRKIEVNTVQGKISLNSGLKIRNYFDKLRSSSFKYEIKLSKKGYANMLFFWGSGFGHGTGLCQEGAMGMAEQGFTYKEIVEHYFPNTKIIKVVFKE
ncbi:MAG: SpoIID/LytB domain-containing protein [Candidatus Omnitrophica bacterium]|nr:SpoIID/LytB domain-containing protein [Candidatus Omnitrophota bacterium]